MLPGTGNTRSKKISQSFKHTTNCINIGLNLNVCAPTSPMHMHISWAPYRAVRSGHDIPHRPTDRRGGTGPGTHQLRWNFNVSEGEKRKEKRTKAASTLGNGRNAKNFRPPNKMPGMLTRSLRLLFYEWHPRTSPGRKPPTTCYSLSSAALAMACRLARRVEWCVQTRRAFSIRIL